MIKKRNIRCNLMALGGILIVSFVSASEVKAQLAPNRYKTDFYYQNVGYQILSDSERTVALSQDFDIDSAGAQIEFGNTGYVRDDIGPNGFLMSQGLFGQFVVIPPTVYDSNGIAYTVKELSDHAINWVSIGSLTLPPTLERLNGGICEVQGLTDLYLPESLKEIDGITYCYDLKTLHIPWSVERIRQYSLSICGLDYIYLPPSVKKLEDYVLAYCVDLKMAMLSGVETMGEGCFNGCRSFVWANLPETLKTMEEGCFNDCDELEVVSLPWSEIKMAGCFNGCPAIKKMEVLAVDPYPFPANSFLDVDRSSCTLVVPIGSEEKYRAAEGWKEFHSIVGELPAMSVSEATVCRVNEFRVIGGKGSLRIISPNSVPVDVYSLGGEKICSVSKLGISEIPLSAGIYVVSSSNGSYKVSVM